MLNIEEGEVEPEFDLQDLYKIYQEINEKGGVVETSSINEFNKVVEKYIGSGLDDAKK